MIAYICTRSVSVRFVNLRSQLLPGGSTNELCRKDPGRKIKENIVRDFINKSLLCLPIWHQIHAERLVAPSLESARTDHIGIGITQLPHSQRRTKLVSKWLQVLALWVLAPCSVHAQTNRGRHWPRAGWR